MVSAYGTLPRVPRASLAVPGDDGALFRRAGVVAGEGRAP